MGKYRVYHISGETKGRFTGLSREDKGFNEALVKLWEEGLSSPEWCFVVEERGKITGRVGYWSDPDNRQEARFFGLEFLKEEKELEAAGQELLTKSLQEMKQQGIKSVGCQLHSDDNLFSLRKRIIERSGLKIVQSKKSFKLSRNRLLTSRLNFSATNRLNFKPLKEVGEQLFTEVIEAVTRESLDRKDELAVVRYGPREAAREHFSILKSIDYSPENWFIACHHTELIGLIVPQVLNDTRGTINYIGVVPGMRGRGYVKDLLKKGVENLINRNMTEIIADIDDFNFPMENALQWAGFAEEKKILIYSFSFQGEEINQQPD